MGGAPFETVDPVDFPAPERGIGTEIAFFWINYFSASGSFLKFPARVFR